MIPLVGDDLVERLRLSRIGLRVFNLFSGGNRGFDDRGGAAGVRTLQRHGDHGASLQIDSMLRFVRQMRSFVFHLRDLRLGIPRMPPVGGSRFLLPFPVQTSQLLARRRVDARCLRERGQERLIALPGVAPHDTAQRRVRLERGGVNGECLALEQSRRHQPLLHHVKTARWLSRSMARRVREIVE
jgi:hypothetical protein